MPPRPSEPLTTKDVKRVVVAELGQRAGRLRCADSRAASRTRVEPSAIGHAGGRGAESRRLSMGGAETHAVAPVLATTHRAPSVSWARRGHGGGNGGPRSARGGAVGPVRRVSVSATYSAPTRSPSAMIRARVLVTRARGRPPRSMTNGTGTNMKLTAAVEAYFVTVYQIRHAFATGLRRTGSDVAEHSGSVWAHGSRNHDELRPAAVAETCRGHRAAPTGGRGVGWGTAGDSVSRAGWRCVRSSTGFCHATRRTAWRFQHVAQALRVSVDDLGATAAA